MNDDEMTKRSISYQDKARAIDASREAFAGAVGWNPGKTC